MSGSSSLTPVAIRMRRAVSVRPLASVTVKPGSMSRTRSLMSLDAVAGHFGPACCEQLGWWHPVARQEALHVCGRGVAWLAGIDHRDTAACPAEHQGGAQTGGAATDDHYFEVLFVHVVVSSCLTGASVAAPVTTTSGGARRASSSASLGNSFVCSSASPAARVRLAGDGERGDLDDLALTAGGRASVLLRPGDVSLLR